MTKARAAGPERQLLTERSLAGAHGLIAVSRLRGEVGRLTVVLARVQESLARQLGSGTTLKAPAGYQFALTFPLVEPGFPWRNAPRMGTYDPTADKNTPLDLPLVSVAKGYVFHAGRLELRDQQLIGVSPDETEACTVCYWQTGPDTGLGLELVPITEVATATE